MNEQDPYPGQEVAFYDTVPTPEAGLARRRDPADSPYRGRAGPGRAPSLGLTMTLLAILLIASLVVLVSGLAMVQEIDAARVISLTIIGLGGGLLVWHMRALFMGSGRRSALLSPWPWTGLLVVAAFGMVLGFALFDMLTAIRSPARIALLAAGLIGTLTGLTGFVRDAELRDRKVAEPAAADAPAIVQPEPVPEQPPVYFDPTGREDELRPIANRARRSGGADAALWEEPAFEQPEPIRRARRAAD